MLASMLALVSLASPTQAQVVPGTEVQLELPATLTPLKPATTDSGYVSVVFGNPAADACVVAVEVYTPAAADRPANLAALQQQVVSDHQATQTELAPPSATELGGRKFVRFASKSTKSNVEQHQLATFVGKSAVVLSFYETGGAKACATLEQAVPASLASKK
jgi:hypothetical protein